MGSGRGITLPAPSAEDSGLPKQQSIRRSWHWSCFGSALKRTGLVSQTGLVGGGQLRRREVGVVQNSLREAAWRDHSTTIRTPHLKITWVLLYTRPLRKIVITVCQASFQEPPKPPWFALVMARQRPMALHRRLIPIRSGSLTNPNESSRSWGSCMTTLPKSSS